MLSKSKTACFTGHRPEKLPDRGSSGSQTVTAIKSMLYKAIIDAVNSGYDAFITGVQRGVDLWAAKIILELADEFHLKLIAVYPYKDIGKSYRNEDRELLEILHEKASEEIVLSEKYYSGCYAVRNQYMVDHSSLLIAVVSDYRSGTGQTISYAKKQGIDMDIIDLTEIFSQYEQLTLE